METPHAIRWNEGLTGLYVEHFDALVATAQRVVRDRSLAEDAVQDCIMKLAGGTCQPMPGKELAYLRTMVRNHALGVIRRQRCGERVASVLAERIPAMMSAAEADALDIIDSEALAADLRALSDRQRTVVQLRFISGLSVQETADRLGLSTGTVKAHTHRGVAALRTMQTAA